MGQHYSVLKEILMITFSLWCKGLLTNLMRTCAQKGKIVLSIYTAYMHTNSNDARARCRWKYGHALHNLIG